MSSCCMPRGLTRRPRARGFSLIEVMVALVITAVGLLGIAKIQALAYASTGSASVRSIVALQAASLAASMHANRDYWAAGLAPNPLTIIGATISDSTLNGSGTTGTSPNTFCNSPATCVPSVMAAYDLHNYAAAIDSMLGNSAPTTTITCPNTLPPINCVIQVTWNEKSVAVNSNSSAPTATVQCTAAATAACTFNPVYTLYVEP